MAFLPRYVKFPGFNGSALSVDKIWPLVCI